MIVINYVNTIVNKYIISYGNGGLSDWPAVSIMQAELEELFCCVGRRADQTTDSVRDIHNIEEINSSAAQAFLDLLPVPLRAILCHAIA